MKKHISVFSLYIRATLLPMLLLFALTAAVQVFMFYGELHDALAVASSRDGGTMLGLETLFGHTSIPIAAYIALILLTILLYIQGTSMGSQTSYTIMRLQVSEKSVFVWQVVYNSLAFLLFWAFEAVLMFVLCEWYAAAVDTSTSQTVFLALYRDEFLHSILPLHEVSRTVRNIAFAVALGTVTAADTRKNCFGKATFSFAMMLLYIIIAFCGDIALLSLDIMNTVVSLLIAGFIIAWILTDKFEFLFKEE